MRRVQDHETTRTDLFSREHNAVTQMLVLFLPCLEGHLHISKLLSLLLKFRLERRVLFFESGRSWI